MKNIDEFSTYHPIVNLTYFGLVIGFSMFFMHPVCIGISFISAVLYNIYLTKNLNIYRYCLPLLIFTAILNPLFNHKGMVILAYFPNGNALTLESIYYGIASALMLCAILLWFSSYSKVLTTDKFVYIFGRFSPTLSLILSMTIKFIPQFQKYFTENLALQPNKKLKCILKSFTATTTYCLETSIITSDSMKARGYGLGHRTSFAIYKFNNRDKIAIIWLIISGILIFTSSIYGNLYWRYFPNINGTTNNLLTIITFALYFVLCNTALIIDILEVKN